MAQGISTTRYVGADATAPSAESDYPPGRTARHADGPRRHVPGRSVLPSGRAILGGLLVAVAAVGTFAAWRQASGDPDTSYVIARHTLLPGQRLTVDDLRTERIALPPVMAAAAFGDTESVVGRVALGPIGEGELLQAMQLSEDADGVHPAEVSFTLPRDRAVDGRLRSGDRIDIFVTRDAATSAVLEQIQVIDVRDAGGTSLVAGADVTITVGLEDPARRADLIDAVRAGEVTLVRSTNNARPAAADEGG